MLLVSATGEIGGGEQVLLSLARHLPAAGFDVSLAAMRPGPLVVAAGQICRQVSAYRPHRYRDLLSVLGGIKWLAKEAKRMGVTLLHSNHAAHLYSSRAARQAGVAEVWHIHDYPYQRDAVQRICERLPTDHLIYTTPHVQAGFDRMNRRYPHSVIAPAAVERESVRPSGDVRTELGLPTDGPLLLTVARAQPHKGHRYLIEAAERIHERHPRVVFVVTGAPTDAGQMRYWDQVQQLIQMRSLDRVIRLVGFVSDAQLEALYRESIALVHPALNEGFGLVLLEAMRAGLPVVAADAAGPSFIIENGKNGLLVPRADPASLSDAIHRILTEPLLRDVLITGGRLSHQAFSPTRMAEAVAQVYRKLRPAAEVAVPGPDKDSPL